MSYAAGEKARASKLNQTTMQAVSSTGSISSPATGEPVYVTTTGLVMVYDGSGWKVASRRPFTHAYTASGTSVSNTTAKAVPLELEIADPLSWHSLVTSNSRITPTISGYYRCKGKTYWPGTLASNVRLVAEIRANGAAITGSKYGAVPATGTQGFVSNVADAEASVFLNGSTDYVELWANQNSGGSVTMDAGSFLIAELVY
jgi:hypothetical protein